MTFDVYFALLSISKRLACSRAFAKSEVKKKIYECFTNTLVWDAKVSKQLFLVILTMIGDSRHVWIGFLIKFSNETFGTGDSTNYRVVRSHNCLLKNFVWEEIALWILRMWLCWNPSTIKLLTSFFRKPLISGSMNTSFSCATLHNRLFPSLSR